MWYYPIRNSNPSPNPISLVINLTLTLICTKCTAQFINCKFTNTYHVNPSVSCFFFVGTAYNPSPSPLLIFFFLLPFFPSVTHRLSLGLWLGVEWDDPSRGKHSGEHNGVQYFTCNQPGSGVFIRPKKISLGYTFVEALQKVSTMILLPEAFAQSVFLSEIKAFFPPYQKNLGWHHSLTRTLFNITCVRLSCQCLVSFPGLLMWQYLGMRLVADAIGIVPFSSRRDDVIFRLMHHKNYPC